MRQRHQATANRIDAISRLVRQGRADGSIQIEHEEDSIYNYLDIGEPMLSGRRLTRVTIELELYDYDLEFLDDRAIIIQTTEVRVAPKQRCRCPETFACPLHNWQHEEFGRPASDLTDDSPDYRGSVDLLVRIVKVIERAEAMLWAVNRLVQIIKVIQESWTMEGSSKRFRMLELD